LGKIHSDLAASLNVLLVGVSHSVYPYKFWINKNGAIKEGKRIKVFLAKMNAKLPDCFGWVYPTPDGFYTETQKKALVEQIKQLAKATPNCHDFAINGNTISTYKAFTVS
jgi:hypothetical protein